MLLNPAYDLWSQGLRSEGLVCRLVLLHLVWGLEFRVQSVGSRSALLHLV